MPKTLPATAQALNDSGKQLADFLLKHQLISQKQLDYALRIRSKLSTPKTLLQVVQELDYIDETSLRNALQTDQVGLRIGDLLVELGYLHAADLHAALGQQKAAGGGKKLGEVLTEGHFIEEHKLTEILSYQMGLPSIDLGERDLDRKLFARAPVNWYIKHKFVPVCLQDDRVLLAFADPTDKADLTVGRDLFGQDALIAIASHKSIEGFIEKFQRVQQNKQTRYDESTVVGIVNGLLEAAQAENASDIHIEPMKDSLRVRMRCDGVLVPYKTFDKELAAPIASRLKILAKADIAERRRHQGGRILFESPKTGNTLDLRVSFYITIYGEKIVLRLLNRKGEMLDLKDIGMAPKMLKRFKEDAIDLPSGVLIITGPTGSGKTTTLYSSVNYLNDNETSIITAEEPVEYIIDGISQCSINPQIGVTFEETLRHIVRQDPDVIVLGEIRDNFSAETAIQAALTGHKVLTTFHTEDSIGGLLRLMNMDIEAFLISSTVVCVVAQRLLRKICPHCAEPYQLTLAEMQRLGYRAEDLAGTKFMLGKGCQHCRFTGARGRLGVFELLVLNEQVKDAILRNCTSYEIRRISVTTSGLVTLFEDGLIKAAQGLVPLREVMRNLPRLETLRPIGDLCRLLGISL
jgi:type IV pilus assembly protein PilB